MRDTKRVDLLRRGIIIHIYPFDYHPSSDRVNLDDCAHVEFKF